MKTDFKIFITYLLVQLMLTVMQNYAQELKYKFEFYGPDEGLNAAPNCLVQDKQGFIWIGSWRGLFRFDGVEFKLFHNIENDTTFLSDNNINCIVFDKEDYLWVGTNKGLNRFNIYSKTVRRFLHDSTSSTNLSDSYITKLFIDSNNTLWVGTKTGGLNKLNLESKTNTKYEFTSFVNNPDDKNCICNNSINSIYGYKNEQGSFLLIGTNNGLSIFDKKTQIFTNYFNKTNNINSLPSNGVTSINVDSENQIWIGTNGGSISHLRFDEELTFENFYFENKTQITTIKEYRDGFLWVGMYVYGLAEFDKIRKLKSNTSPFYDKDFPRGSDINDMLIDSEGRMWMGTRWGLHKYDPNIKKFNYKYMVPSKRVWFGRISSFCRDKQNNLWVGTLGSGVVKLNSLFIEKDTYKPNINIEGSICSVCITDMVASKSGDIWIGTDRGLERYNSKLNNFIHYSEKLNQSHPNFITNAFINDLYIDRKDDLWIGSAGGISKYDGKMFTHYLTSLEQRQQLGFYIGEIYQDKNNKYWLGANSLYSFDPNENKVEKYRNKNSGAIIDHMAFSIVEDNKGDLWVATFGGLYEIEKNGNMNHFTTKDGLPNNITYGILKDNSGMLWIETFKGIIKINPENYLVERYNFEGDFLPNQFGAKGIYKDNKGMFYLSQPNRIAYFNPNEIKLNKKLVPVVITNLKVSDNDYRISKSFSDDEEISLAHYENRLEINWSGITFTNSDKVKYTYKLEGYKDDWVECETERKTTFTNLNPGDYIFSVKAYNDDGILNNKAAILRITINPPLWAEWWIRALFLVSIIFGIILLHKRRVRYYKNERKKQEQFSKKLIQSQEEERKRIAGELHDSLGQNLMIIHNRIQYFFKGKKELPAELEPLIPEVKETIEEVREIARNLHPHQLEQLGLTKAIESVIRKTSRTSEINFTSKIEFIDKFLAKEEWIHVYRILQEALTNIIKHSSANEVQISLVKKWQKIILEISDNGKGMNLVKENSNHGFGLQNIRERAKLLNAQLEIDTSTNNGVKILVELPVSLNAN